MSICCICHKTVKPGLSIRHSICNHMTHGHCMDQVNPNFELCALCEQAGMNEEPEFCTNMRDPQQPRTFEGRDYIEDPLLDQDSLVSRVGSYVWNRKKSGVVDPKELLGQALPLKHLVAEYGCTLQFMLANRVTIYDFLVNGYSF